MTAISAPQLARDLIEKVGLKKSYASQLARRLKTPALQLAVKIERTLGIPCDFWVELNSDTCEAIAPRITNARVLAAPSSADSPRSDDHGGLTPSESYAAEHPLAGSDGVSSTLGLGRSRSDDMADKSHVAAHNSPPILIGNLEHQTGECAEVAR